MSTLDKQRWTLLSPLLDKLLEADEAARGTLIEEIGRGDQALATELSGLLQRHSAIENSGFLEGSLLGAAAEPTLAGQQIGSYTLERLLGRGGMGSVWLAQRSDGRYHHQVAIKFLNLALFGPQGVSRFRREGQALARLTHANIARLIDAGVTRGEQPYLILEYVEGDAIDRWSQAHALDVTARVKLFVQVLDAVAHAHSKLILHRDLKPSNILVTLDGQVKLLDFGIAKLLDEVDNRLTADVLTHLPVRGFTPGYAAPEQINGGEVTTASDVYALGVLLYVMLTGKHPLTSAGQTPVDHLRAVVETEPPLPSEAVARAASGTSDATLVDLPAHVSRALRGDLDNIVSKALKKSPAERYQTVQAFAEDLQRYLNNEPVSARRDSLWYRAGKFVARNRPAVAAATLVILAILAGAGVAVWQAREASRERDHARSLLARHASVVNFVTTMLTEVAPLEQPVRLGELLDRSRSMLLPLEADPERRAVILALISDYYLDHDEMKKAGPLLSQARALTRDSTDSILRGGILCRSAFAALAGEPGDPLALAKEGLALTAEDARESIICLQALSAIAQSSGDGRAAFDLTLRAQALLQASGMRAPGFEIALLRDAASDHYTQGDLIGAYRFNERALAALAAAGLGLSRISLDIHSNWGKTNLSVGDELRAIELLDAGVQLAATRWPGEPPPERMLGNRAAALSRLARYDDALIAFDQAVAAGERRSDSIWLDESRAERAASYVAIGNLTAAEQELATLLPQLGTTISRESPAAVVIRTARALLDATRGDLAAALSGYSQNIDLLSKRSVIAAPLIQALVARADVYLRLGNFSEALADARRALELARNVRSPSKHSSFVGESLLMLARVQENLGQPGEARTSANEAVPHLEATLGAQHPLTLRSRAMVLSVP